MPLRWSAPESILYDKFSCWSDAYMTGQTLYELFTHGCYPFTELYGYDLDDMLQLVRWCFLDGDDTIHISLALIQWNIYLIFI